MIEQMNGTNMDSATGINPDVSKIEYEEREIDTVQTGKTVQCDDHGDEIEAQCSSDNSQLCGKCVMLHKDHVEAVEKRHSSTIVDELAVSLADLDCILEKAQTFVQRLDIEVLAGSSDGKKVEADTVTTLRHELYTFLNEDTNVEILKGCIVQREPKFKNNSKVKVQKDGLQKKGKISTVSENILYNVMLDNNILMDSVKEDSIIENNVLDQNCTSNHGLAQFLTQNQGFSCDTCHQSQTQNSPMFGCRKCNQDVCEKCWDSL